MIATQGALLEQLASVSFPITDEKRVALDEAVTEFTHVRRRDGWSVEQIIVALKDVVREARGARASQTNPAPVETVLGFENLTRDLVTASIKRYFAPRSSREAQ